MEKLLILDIDETLLYATESQLAHGHDFEADQYFVYLRPYLREFLEFCFEHFRVAVWTSSNEWYAQFIIEKLFRDKNKLEFVWSRERCVRKFNSMEYSFTYIKDLKKVKKRGYSLEKIIMVNDSPEKLVRNYGNLVRVTPFYGDQRDEEFLDLMSYLEHLKFHENIRKVEKRGWKNRRV
jgi:RNA polymerase II subunit A small phosphatase-like protein